MMMGAMNPMAGMGMMAGAAKTSATGVSNQDDAREPKGKKSKNIVRAATMPSSVTDPAYPVAITASPSVVTLATIIGAGTDGKVQWDSLVPAKNKSKTGIQFVKVQFEFALKNTAWTQDQPSVDLKAAIEKCLDVRSNPAGICTAH
jgi:hypothetical protein